MKQLGLDLESVESKGLLNFIRIPVISNIDTFIETLTPIISSDSHKVVVFDSINPVFEVLESHSRRAWLSNFFYNLAQTINGLVVIVVEFPYELETIRVAEFVSDAVVILKQRIEDRFLVRFMEIRKARGSPITLAVVPFSIEEKIGLRVWIPPVLSEVASEGEELHFRCEALRRVWKSLRRGEVVNIVYPPDSRYPDISVLILLQFLVYGVKTLLISYRYPPNVIEEILLGKLIEYGVEENTARALLSKHLKIVSINPFSYSTSQLAIKELETIEKEKPDIVAFHGVEVARAASDLKTYVSELFNEINYLKNLKIVAVRLTSYISDEIYRIESSLADAIARIDCVKTPSEVSWTAYLWRKGYSPHLMTASEVRECARELVDALRELRGNS